MDWQNIAANISDTLGISFEIEQHSNVGGGCINSAFRVSGGGQSYFVKLNRADLLDMFVAEAEGLAELNKPAAIRVPKPVCYGTSAGQAYIVMENLPFGGGQRDAMRLFGRQLAEMHRYTADQFGWRLDNTIGATHQPNDKCDDWVSFWQEQRLGYQLKLASRQGASHRMLDKGDRLLAHVADFFTDYQPVASLLHGDLWSGNYSVLSSGEPVIFDPAVYYGDRETDLAMTELFGGFGADFYAAYNESWPLDHGYQIRKTFYNLYHIINHFVLFGGGYGS
ncbi:MAG: fructosamine kinase family protein, partial [Gammaproteobacteria bacterium]|nr:fructosamine kinase family protein [Gammaproteobacteria bacterium]